MGINAQELQGQWNELRGKVKEKWGHLTDDDLEVQGGNFDQLIGRIQKKTGEGRGGHRRLPQRPYIERCIVGRAGNRDSPRLC